MTDAAVHAEHADADEATAQSLPVSKNAVRSGGWLVLRQAAVQGIGALTGLLIARWGTPADFGFYAIINFGFYALLAPGDLGLGASLVRHSRHPTRSQLRNVQAVRNAIDVVLFLVLWAASPALAARYGMDSLGGTEAIRLLALAALLQSFQIVPTVLLERGLRFKQIAAIEVAQTAVYSCTALYLTAHGWGVMGFAAAWLGFSATGALLSFACAPWAVGWHLDPRFIKARIPFSLPYQASSAVNLARDAVTPVLIGLLLGAADVGYVNWALMLAMLAGLTVLALQRVCFAAFVKLLSNREELQRTFTALLRAAHAVAALPAVLLLFFAEPIAVHVFGERWLAALPLFYMLWPANLIMPTLQPVIAALHALGRTALVLRINAALTLLMWIAAVPLVLFFGPAGFAGAFLLYQGSSLWMVRLLRRERLDAAVIQAAWLPWAGALLSAAASQLLWHVQGGHSLAALLASLIGGGALYVAFGAAYLRRRKGSW